MSEAQAPEGFTAGEALIESLDFATAELQARLDEATTEAAESFWESQIALLTDSGFEERASRRFQSQNVTLTMQVARHADEEGAKAYMTGLQGQCAPVDLPEALGDDLFVHNCTPLGAGFQAVEAYVRLGNHIHSAVVRSSEPSATDSEALIAMAMEALTVQLAGQ